MKYCCGRNRQENKKLRAQTQVNKRYTDILFCSLKAPVLQDVIPVNQNTNFSTSSPLFFHLQSAVKFHNFAILGGERRERGESVESKLRSERSEEIRKILIKIAQGFHQTDKTRLLKLSFSKL